MILSINLLEKIIILNSLPTSGSLKEMRIIRNMNNIFPLTNEEKEYCGIKINEDNSFQCNNNALIKTDYNITHDELDVLKEIVMLWDEKKEVNDLNLNLCEQIQSL